VRIVIDTNVIISALFYGGLPNTLLELVAKGRVKPVASNEIISEYKEIVERISDRTGKLGKATAFNVLLSKIDLICSTTKISASRDPDDDKFISCAIDGKCKYIVSGDKDLLDLKSFENVEIVTVSSFLEEFI